MTDGKLAGRRSWGVLAGAVLLMTIGVVWFLAAPTSPVTAIARGDVEGTWVLDRPPGQDLTVVFAADGSFVADDWLVQLGCPEWLEGLTLDNLAWGSRVAMHGTWGQTFDPVSDVSSQVDVFPADRGSCSAAPSFRMQRSFLTGESFLLLYLDGLQQEDEALRFAKQR